MPRPRRGDLWQVDFGRPVGHEQGSGARPALVLSTDPFNDSGAGVVVVAPLTTADRGYPSRVRIRRGESGLHQTSWAAIEHLRSVSVLRLSEYLGSVDPPVLGEVDNVLGLLLLDAGDDDLV